MSGAVAVRAEMLMGTVVTIDVPARRAETDAAVERAFEWFRRIEDCCSRFDRNSELSRLTAQVGVAVPTSSILYEALRFALAVAKESGGAFDPTVGHRMEARGFNRDDRTGQRILTQPFPVEDVTYRDVHVDPERRTVTILRPLVLDLGAVAKGLAVDAAARELQPFGDFAIDAGGDLYLGGLNPDGQPWSVGIRHPREDRQLIASLRVTNRAVCTSGDYERVTPNEPHQHHIIDPRTGSSPTAAASVTVVAPTAMVADALATAAFVLGPVAGLALLERMGVDGLMFTTDLTRHQTPGLAPTWVQLKPDTTASLGLSE